MQIDSTPLDVLVLLADGTPERVKLTGMIDVAIGTVPAAVLRPDDQVGGRRSRRHHLVDLGTPGRGGWGPSA